MGELNKLFRKNSIWIITNTTVGAVVSTLVTIYMVRELSVEDYGIYNIMFALITYISILSSFGIVNVFQRFIPELNTNKDTHTLKTLVIHGLILRLVLSAIFVGLVILFSGEIEKLMRIGNWINYFKLFSLGIIFYLEIGLMNVVLGSLFLHKYIAIANIPYLLARAGCIYFVLKTGFGLQGVFLSEVVAWGALLFMLVYSYYSKFSKFNPVKRKANFPVKRFFQYGGYSFFHEVGGTILDVSTDYFVLSAFLGPAAVGIYAFANRVVHLFTRYLPHQILQNIINPIFFTKYAETGDSKDLERMYNLLVKVNIFLLFPFAVGVLVLGDKMITLIFGSKYLSSFIPLCIVALFTAINTYARPLGLVFKAIEKVDILLYSKVFAIYNIIGDLVVAKPYGVTGIALVTSSAVLFQGIFLYIYAKKYTGLTLDLRGLSVILSNSAVMGLLLYPLRTIVTGVPSLILVIVIGAIFYFLAAYFNKTFSLEERMLINKVIAKPIFPF